MGTVPLYATTTKYITVSALIHKICWLRGVLSELEFNSDEPMKVCMDSKSAINLAINPVHHKRSKHIAIKYHWIRHMVGYNLVKLVHVASEMQLADMLTKALAEVIFNELTERVLG